MLRSGGAGEAVYEHVDDAGEDRVDRGVQAAGEEVADDGGDRGGSLIEGGDRGVEQLQERCALGAEAGGEVVAQGVEVELLREVVARAFGEMEAGGEVEAEVGVEAVDAGQHESPAEIGAVVAGAGREQGHDGLAVAVEDLFRELDGLGAAVALDFALVGVELQLPRGARCR